MDKIEYGNLTIEKGNKALGVEDIRWILNLHREPDEADINFIKDIYEKGRQDGMKEIQEKSKEESSEPRAMTSEELTEKFLKTLKDIIEYWAGVPGNSVQDKIEGALFSTLVVLDGDTCDLPAFDIVARPHPEDKEFDKSCGENWIEPGTILEDHLHELFS